MFKLPPIVQDLTICLRCRYRLSSQKGGRRKNSGRPTPNLQHVRRFAPGRSLGQEQAPLGVDDTFDNTISLPISKYEPEDRSRRFAGQRRLYPQRKDSLGVDVLGEPAEVLVLQDRQGREKHNAGVIWSPSRGPDKDPTDGVFSSLEMLGKIEGERGLVDADQVFENIENIRVAWDAKSKTRSGPVSVADYADLTSQLMKGFTVKQLAAYLTRTSSLSHLDPMDLRVQYSGVLYARSDWSPGVTSMEQVRAPKLVRPAEDERVQEAVSRNKPESNRLHKPTLVNKILQHRWLVKPKHNEDSLGELNIHMQWMHLHLIMNHKRGILKQLSESYGAKIDASRKDRIIRVTSDYDTCLDVLKVIVSTLENIRCAEFDLPVQLKKDLYSGDFHELGQTMLREVEQLTNTLIETKSTQVWRREIHIHYLGPSVVDLQDAQRSISQMLKPKHAIDHRLIWASALNPSETIPVPVDVGAGLPLVDRDQQWSRWSGPTIRQIDLGSMKNIGNEPLNTLASPLAYENEASKALNRFFATPSHTTMASEDPSLHWTSERRYWDSAILGQVIFPTKAANEKYVRAKGKAKGVKNERLRIRLGEWRREFVSLVPGLVRSLEHLGLETLALGMESKESLLISLAPSFRNTSLPVSFEALPDLEIQIAFDNDSQTTSIKDVRTVFKREFDFLLPQNTVDMRFVRRTCVHSNPEHLNPRISQFIKNSNLDIWGTERLQTPTGLEIEVPSHAFRRRSGSSNETPKQCLVDYAFASLEHRSSLSIPFRQAGSWSDLTYTSIEAGKIGGRSSSLSLSHPNSDPENRFTAQDSDTHSIPPLTSGSPDSFSSTSEKLHSLSLLRKANALINMIEDRPDTGDDGISDKFAYQAEKDRQASLKKSAATQRLHLNLADDSPVAPLRRVIADKLNLVRPVRPQRQDHTATR